LKRYILTLDARQDVQQIWAFIAQDSIDHARRVVDEFTAKFEFLGRNPHAGRS